MPKSIKSKSPFRFRLVMSEASDWYVIPADKLTEWQETYRYEEPPDWAQYVCNTWDLTFTDPS